MIFNAMLFFNFSRDDPDYIEEWLDKRINKLSCEDRFKFYDLSDARGAQYDECSHKSSIYILFL